VEAVTKGGKRSCTAATVSLSTTTIGAVHLVVEPTISGVLSAWRVQLCLRSQAEQVKANRQESGTMRDSQEAEVSHACEAVREWVQQEAT
jgi:hypothetical protein